ncbi:MAG: hypothetical protein ABIZ49_10690 [Opitutaceae bacterium]
MKSRPAPSPRSWATWFYRQLLRLYPAAFRRRYEEEMFVMFASEWRRASAGGVGAQWRCGWRVMGDFFRTAPHEWLERVPRIAILTWIAVLLSARYLAIGPLPLLLKVLGCAGLTTTFAVAVVAIAGRTRAAQLKLAVLGLPIGAAFGLFLGLSPKVLPPPETPLVAVTDPTLTGSVIYERMRAAYANAKTYADEGEVQTVYAGPLSRVERRPFSTAFVRGQGFRFKFSEQFTRLDRWKEYAIWTEGGLAKRWWTILPRVEVDRDLAGALGAAAGVSGATSTLVPGLLQPDLRTGFLSNARSAIVLLGTQRVDGLETFRLQVTPPYGPTQTVWIARQTYLIDRIADSTSLWGSIRAKSTIVYRPQLNSPVSATALTFQPEPGLAGWRMFVNGDIYATIFACTATLLVILLNVVHRRVLRKRARGKESWLTPLGKRLWGGNSGNIAIGAVSLGMWMSGGEVRDVLQNFLLALFALQGGFLLYVMHRRSRGYARFAGVR